MMAKNRSECLSIIAVYISGMLLISSICQAKSSFIVNPANVTACQNSTAKFQCQTSDNVPIFWLINDTPPSLAGVPHITQNQVSTLDIPNTSSLPGAYIMCYYVVQPSRMRVNSTKAFLTVIGPSSFPNLTTISVNHTTTRIAWSHEQINETTVFNVSIHNKQGVVVYNVSTRDTSLMFNSPDPCDLYYVTVGTTFTCMKTSSAILSGVAPSAITMNMLNFTFLYPVDINSFANVTVHITFSFQQDVCTYMIVASTANQVIQSQSFKPKDSMISIPLPINNIYNLTINASNTYGNTIFYVSISSFDVMNVTIDVSSSTGFCEVSCHYNSGSNAQGCLVHLEHSATGEEYCIALSYNSTLSNKVLCGQSIRDQIYRDGMYYVTAYDIEINGYPSEMPAVKNVTRTCFAVSDATKQASSDATKQTNDLIALAALTVLVPVMVVITVILICYCKNKQKPPVQPPALGLHPPPNAHLTPRDVHPPSRDTHFDQRHIFSDPDNPDCAEVERATSFDPLHSENQPMLENQLTPSLERNRMDPASISNPAVRFLIFCDLATTGLNIHKACVIQIGAAVHSQHCIVEPTFVKLVYTDIVISQKANELTGISKEMLINEKHFKDVFADFLMWIDATVKNTGHSSIPVLVAHNGFRFDFPIIYAEMHRNGMSSDIITSRQIHFADTLHLLRKAEKSKNYPALDNITCLTMENLVTKFLPNYNYECKPSSVVTAMNKLFGSNAPLYETLQELEVRSWETLLAKGGKSFTTNS